MTLTTVANRIHISDHMTFDQSHASARSPHAHTLLITLAECVTKIATPFTKLCERMYVVSRHVRRVNNGFIQVISYTAHPPILQTSDK